RPLRPGGAMRPRGDEGRGEPQRGAQHARHCSGSRGGARLTHAGARPGVREGSALPCAALRAPGSAHARNRATWPGTARDPNEGARMAERTRSDTHVSEHEARAVAEASRETGWIAPSFVRELFLGRLA